MCRRVCSTTELRFTLERRPKQNLEKAMVKSHWNGKNQKKKSGVPVCIAGVCKAIHRDTGLRGVEGLTHAGVEFIIRNGTPKCRFMIQHRLCFNWDQRVVRRGRGTSGIRCLITMRTHRRGVVPAQTIATGASSRRRQAGAVGADRLVLVCHVSRRRGLCHGKGGVIRNHVSQVLNWRQVVRFQRNLK